MSIEAPAPVAATQHGSMFNDRDDAGLSWYLPAFAPIDPSDVFAFAANEGTIVDGSGNPLDTATATIAVASAEPPDVTAARQTDPGRQYKPMPATGYSAVLALPYKDAQGNDQLASVPGTVAVASDGSLLVTFSALLGATVLQAYEELGQLGGASIELSYGYDVVAWFVRPIRTITIPQWIEIGPGRRPVQEPLVLSPFARARPIPPVLLPQGPAPGRDRRAPFIRPEPPDPIIPRPIPVGGMWITEARSGGASIALATIYAAPRYRPKYTITTRAGNTRAIVDATDLKDFDAQHTEFRELTSLGDVHAKYPSIERCYIGEVSGTVVVVPAAYAIAHGAGGCAARIDAVIDTSPASISGSRFQLTFELTPAIDPVDLAQLVEDLQRVPEAAGAALRPALPSGIDTRVASTFSAEVSNLSFANAPDGGGLLMSFGLTDTGSTPALVNVNLLLAQLTATTTTPLFGTVGVRLDDVYTPPVQATVLLSLATTGDGDDVTITIGGTPAAVTATNQSPNDVTLVRMLDSTATDATIQPLATELPAGQQATLPVADPAAVTSVVVQRTLVLPDPFPRAALSHFIDVHAETVQQAMHSLSVNATSIDFTAAQIAELDIAISLDALPAVAVPSITLNPQHRIDTVDVVVPIAVAIAGLAATLTITVHGANATPTRQAEAHNDFAADPIFILTAAAIAPQPTSEQPQSLPRGAATWHA